MEDESRREKGKGADRCEKMESAEVASSPLLTDCVESAVDVFTQVDLLSAR